MLWKNNQDTQSLFMRLSFLHHIMPLLLISTALLSFSHASNAAKIYRWVDDNGQIDFSENPPRGQNVERVKVKVQSGGAAATSSGTPVTASKPKEAPKTEQSLTAEPSQEEKDKYCQQSRDLLQQMQGNPNRRFKQEDGSFQKLSEDQRADYLAQAKDGISRFCK